MAHPKRKQSKTRRDKRRTHYKAKAPTMSTCQNCGATIRSHHVCPECGHYRGQLVIDKEIDVK
ncbi:MAG: 50S ribosomal protein L32 [Bacteroidota bacterium]|nr:50S ribosomal protein L32 [Bacteroidota bacterium]